MNILWFSWRDLAHPRAGGAEVVANQLASRLAADGHQVKFIVGGFAGGNAQETINGYLVNRVGGRYSVYYKAWRFYRRHKLAAWADMVIDEVNTVPFFAKFYPKRGRGYRVKGKPHTPNPKPQTLLFIHQLARQIWFYQLPKAIGLVGYLLEPLYLRLLNNSRVITVSNSTEQDLLRYGFKAKNIKIISEGIELAPLKILPQKDTAKPILLSLGSIRAMKKTVDQLKAFEIAKKTIPNLRLVVAGNASDPYGQKFLKAVAKSPYKDDIQVLGKVSPAQKAQLLRQAALISVTSVKEGWGLIVTEAASQGTPAVVYNVDGLRDSVQNNVTGCIVSNNSPQALADKIISVIGDPKMYQNLRQAGWQYSQQITFDQSYQDFKKALNL